MVGDLPVLRRRPDEIQIGLDPRPAAVASGLSGTGRRAGPAAHRPGPGRGRAGRGGRAPAAAARAAGRAHRHTACSTTPPARPARCPAGWRATWPRPAVRGRRSPRRTTRPHGVASRSSVHGDGRLAVSVATLLAAAGVGWVHVSAAGTVRPEDTGTGYRRRRRGRGGAPAAARAAIRRADPTVRTGAFRADRGPDLVVLTDAVVPEPSRVACTDRGRCAASARPHPGRHRHRRPAGGARPDQLPALRRPAPLRPRRVLAAARRPARRQGRSRPTWPTTQATSAFAVAPGP